MSKQGSTKERILELISEGSDNLSEISERLNLAPSTVSKHIHDLESSNAIEQKSNPHVKKWKYYKLNDGAGAQGPKGGAGFATKRNGMAVTAIALALIALFAFAHPYAVHGTVGNAYVPISITDPPIVPSGTQALYINYTSVKVQVGYEGGSEWIPINSSGRLELMSLINESQGIGGANVMANSTIDQVEFNIVSGSITVDNVTYPLTITKKQMVAAVMNNKKVNGTSGVLLDFSPIVTPVYANNATTFMLNPSLMAAMVPGTVFGGQTQQGSGQQYPLQQKYADLFRGNDKNLTITNASLASEGNDTSLSITLKNDGNSSVTVMGVVLMGDVMPYFAPNSQAINALSPNALGFNCSQVMDLPMEPAGWGTLQENVLGFFNGLAMNGSSLGESPSSNAMEFNGSAADRMGPERGALPGGPDGSVSGKSNSSVVINASDAPNGLPFGGMHMPGAAEFNKSASTNFPLGEGEFNHSNSSVVINASAAIAIGKACGVDRIGIRLPAPANDIQISGIEKAASLADSQDGLSMRFAFMHPIGVNFAVGDNAVLSMQFPWEDSNQAAAVAGYALAPGTTVTLGYAGKLVIGRGAPDASLNDSSYVIMVMTSKGVAQANVTSS